MSRNLLLIKQEEHACVSYAEFSCMKKLKIVYTVKYYYRFFSYFPPPHELGVVYLDACDNSFNIWPLEQNEQNCFKGRRLTQKHLKLIAF